MSLVTPHAIQALQRKLYLKAKYVDEHCRIRVASADTTQLFVRDQLSLPVTWTDQQQDVPMCHNTRNSF